MPTNTTAERLRKKSRKTVLIEDPKDPSEKYQFDIRALSPFELADNDKIFDALPKEGVTISKDMPEASRKQLKEVVLPMMKIFLPKCTTNPQITFNRDEESDNIVHIGDIPIMVATMVFKEILDLSGISAEAEEERKKKSQIAVTSSTSQ